MNFLDKVFNCEKKQVEEKSTDLRYLQNLKFDPILKKRWFNFFVENFRVVFLLIFIISVWGIVSYLKLPKESNPEVKIPFAAVSTFYPGASPTDVEELVTKKVENEISAVSGIKKITSSSANSLSVVTVEFEAGEDLENSIRKVKDKVDLAKNDLPEEAEDPQVREISIDDQPIMTMVLSGPYDGLVLREYAEKIEDELKKNSGVREIRISGGDEEEFEIAYDPEKLSAYLLNPNSINAMIASNNAVIPAGNFEGEKFVYPIKSDSRFFAAEELAFFPIGHNAQGGLIYLKDVASVKEKAIKKTIYSRLSVDGAWPENAVTIDVIKRTGGSIINIGDEAKATLEKVAENFPEGMRYDIVTDVTKIIREDFSGLFRDFLITLGLVFFILFLVVGLKEALVAGLAIPLVFFATFGVMLLSGISLNFLSIFSLILALGLLVDDAIVVVSATKQYLKTGKFTPEEAILLVLNDFKGVLTSTTLTTVWAFLPLFMVSGIMGEYLKSIPITVSTTLLASLLIALTVNHPLAAVLERMRFDRKLFFATLLSLVIGFIFLIFSFQVGSWQFFVTIISGLFFFTFVWKWYLRKGRDSMLTNEALMRAEKKDDNLIKEKLQKQGSHADKNFWSRLMHGILCLDKVVPVYEVYLKKVLATGKSRLATVVFITITFFFSLALLFFGVVKLEFFPNSDSETIYVSVEGPAGMKLEETDKTVSDIEKKLMTVNEIVNFSTVTGRAGFSESDSGSSGEAGNLAGIVITLKEKNEREKKSYEIADSLRAEFSEIKNVKTEVFSPKGGPPAGAAFEARIVGEDLAVLDKIANELAVFLENIPGTVNVSVSLKNAPAEYTFQLDREKMEIYGINGAIIGSALRLAINGIEVTQIIKDDKEMAVVARFASEKIENLNLVENIQIANFQNKPIFLKDVASINLNPSVESIQRIDQKRVVVLSAGVSGKTRPADILAVFQKKIEKDYVFPEGYSIDYGGENEENQRSVIEILQAMIAAIFLIIATLIIQFNSFRQALIVLATLPLALIGVFVGMAVFQVNLSFPGLIGILALFGIVVKNAIILVDKINLNLRSGIAADEAIVDAGKSRLEAIFITSLSTIFGILPVTLSNEVWTALGSAVIFGLSVSSFLTLFIVPLLFKMTMAGGEE